MANLIIKSSADNLVLQGSDASPAITVGATGTLTFAENVTMSGTANVYGAGTFPAGHIIQVLQSVKADKINTTSNTATATGLSQAITPSATSSKILITVAIGSVSHGTANERIYFKIDGTVSTSVGDAATGHECAACSSPHRASYDQESLVINFLDSPSTTSAKTYALHWWTNTGTAYLNSAGTTDASSGNTIATITCMEIAG